MRLDSVKIRRFKRSEFGDCWCYFDRKGIEVYASEKDGQTKGILLLIPQATIKAYMRDLEKEKVKGAGK